MDLLRGGISIPDPRNGEFIKNSSNVPFRLVFRSHSFLDTTTTASSPRRVILCGPSVSAFCTTSLNLALASATVQVALVIPHLSDSHNGHYSHLREAVQIVPATARLRWFGSIAPQAHQAIESSIFGGQMKNLLLLLVSAFSAPIGFA